MATMFPISLDLNGRRVLVVGGGRVALRKVELLLAAGAEVVVVGPQVCEELAALDGPTLHRRQFTSQDLDNCTLAIAATDRPEVNEQVCRDARRKAVLVNVVDQPELCDFHVPASIRRGRLCVAISTGGASPSLAARLRRELEGDVPKAYGQFADLLAEMRAEVIRRIPQETVRRELFAALCDKKMFGALLARGPDAARARMLKKIAQVADGLASP